MPEPSSRSLSTRASSINRSLDEIGDKWCLIILQEIFWGINNFNGLLKASGMSRGVLSDRLKWLERIKCLKKVTPENSRRPVYKLTAKSNELYSTALMATVWEQRFFHTPDIRQLSLIHQSCGKNFSPVMRCNHCSKDVKAKDVSYQPGPGAQQDVREKKVRRRSSISALNAPNENAAYKNMIHIIGDRWTANVISLAYHGMNRFDQFHAELPIATNILSDRLKFLSEEGIFIQVPYQEKPVRHEYHLSEKGLAMYPLFLTLLQWGDRWCDTGDGAPMIPHHHPCDNDFIGLVCCNQCNQSLEAHQVRFFWEQPSQA